MGKDCFIMNWKKYLCEERMREEHVIDETKDRRNPFEVDFGKVVFCPAIRRMHDKTQVIPLSSGDCILTRLTHSMHVMDVAESLACNYIRNDSFKALYDNEEDAFEDAQRIRAILKSASLLHDIGNPPFGHFGEETIKDFFVDFFDPSKLNDIVRGIDKDDVIDFTQFDGNTQGLRIVSKLQYTGTLDGLNLTYGTLGAYMKYPNEGERDENGYVGNHKHGVFKTERDLFRKIVDGCNMRNEDGTVKRHPLAFLVEAADTICYGTMDVEDGLYQGWYDVKYLLEELSNIISERTGRKEDILKIIGYNITLEELQNMDYRQARLELREYLITYLVDLTIRNFVSKLDRIDSGEYGKKGEELVYDDPNYVAEALKDFTRKKILSNKDVLKFEVTGNSVITGLFVLLIQYSFHKRKSYRTRLKGIISESRLAVAMKEDLPDRYPENKNISSDEIGKFDIGDLSTYARLRMIVDFVSSMTDRYSVELYQTLSGNSL